MKATREAYNAAFETECARSYSIVGEYERATGYSIDSHRLLDAARVLACPVKRNPPCWQHGRILYATARRYLELCDEFATFLDIGTAKGFSALVMAWALADAGKPGIVISLDVIDPYTAVDRNSILDPLTVPEFVDPWWPRSVEREFHGMSGKEWLETLADSERIHFAFVDGKHDFAAVSAEAKMISAHQEPGDIAIFDDVHVPGVYRAVRQAPYELDYIQVLPQRSYAVGVRL